MSLKRDSSHLSSPSSHDSILAQKAKRVKVEFNDNVDVRVMDDYDSKPFELVREEVRSAIEGHLRPSDTKDDTVYEQLRQVFASAAVGADDSPSRRRDVRTDEKPSSVLLKKYVVALLGRVRDLKECPRLVYSILDINWFGREESFVLQYRRFLGALGSAIPGFVKAIMERIVRHFTELPSSLGRVPGDPTISRRQMLDRLHSVLEYLLRLIPSASGDLAVVLRSEFPNHRTATRRAYISYVTNLFKIAAFTPELKGDILTLTLERIVKIDVEVQEELDDLEEDVDEGIMGGPGKTSSCLEDEDDDSNDSDAESTSSTELSTSLEQQRLEALRDTVAKLDAVLDLLFDHYTTTFTSGNKFESLDSFDHLLSQFSTFVMPTYRSRHTQFLVFHFAQVDRMLTERFVGHCVQIILGRNIPSNTAISAAAYLASFIARGARVPKYLVREVVMILTEHLSQLRRAYELTCRGPDLGRYSVYYAISQAILYIFCFRWRDLIKVSAYDDAIDLDDYDVFASGEPAWVPGFKENLNQSIYTRLNPLKVCSPTIVHQFAAIASHLRFMFVYPLLEMNKKIRLSSYRSYPTTGSVSAGRRETALSAKAGEEHHQLDAFFPFDPYQLSKSKRWLQGDYNEWKGVPGMKQADDDDDEDDDDDDGSEVDSDEDEGASDEDDVEEVGSQSS